MHVTNPQILGNVSHQTGEHTEATKTRKEEMKENQGEHKRDKRPKREKYKKREEIGADLPSKDSKNSPLRIKKPLKESI
jgi:hypothetical protein